MIALDTGVIIGALQHGNAHHDRVRRFLIERDAEGETICVPAVAVAEVLAYEGLDASQRASMATIIESRFITLSFDGAAALRSATFMARANAQRRAHIAANPTAPSGDLRQLLKADAMILGTAAAAGAAALATLDPDDMTAIAGNDIRVINVLTIPLNPEQVPMFPSALAPPSLAPAPPPEDD